MCAGLVFLDLCLHPLKVGLQEGGELAAKRGVGLRAVASHGVGPVHLHQVFGQAGFQQTRCVGLHMVWEGVRCLQVKIGPSENNSQTYMLYLDLQFCTLQLSAHYWCYCTWSGKESAVSK